MQWMKSLSSKNSLLKRENLKFRKNQEREEKQLNKQIWRLEQKIKKLRGEPYEKESDAWIGSEGFRWKAGVSEYWTPSSGTTSPISGITIWDKDTWDKRKSDKRND